MSDDDIVDLSDAVETEYLSLCPLCDEPILHWEPYALFIAHDCIVVGHVICISDVRKRLGI